MDWGRIVGIGMDSKGLQPKRRSDQEAYISEWFARGHRGWHLARKATAE